MILATTKVEDYERFLEVFSTTGAEKRAEHGSKGATVFRGPAESDRVWVLTNAWRQRDRRSSASSGAAPCSEIVNMRIARML
jgi:hypothetical protein